MEFVQPNLEWYKGISNTYGLSPRCPYSSVHRCPRFYQSLSLLGKAGSTEINKDEDERLKIKWEKTDLWPTTDEQGTITCGSSDERRHFLRFCPEVSYERFGWFASDLVPYVDEIGQNRVHELLSKEGDSSTDWRWCWIVVSSQHYTDCPLYSLLEAGAEANNHKKEIIAAKSNESVVDRFITRIKNHRILSILILIGIILIAIASFTEAIGNIAEVINSIFNFATSP